jgi:uncharacterized protein YbjT (DUF2867 family)
VEALTDDGHAGQTYEVTGPDALTFAEARATTSEASGRLITYEGSPDEYRSANPAASESEIAYFTNQRRLGDATPTDT